MNYKTPDDNQKCYLEFVGEYVPGLSRFHVGWWNSKPGNWTIEYGQIRVPASVVCYWWSLQEEDGFKLTPAHK